MKMCYPNKINAKVRGKKQTFDFQDHLARLEQIYYMSEKKSTNNVM